MTDSGISGYVSVRSYFCLNLIFKDSPERVSKRVEWSSDDEQKEKNKRIGNDLTKCSSEKYFLGKTGDMADLIYDFHHQDKDLREIDIKTIERKV